MWAGQAVQRLESDLILCVYPASHFFFYEATELDFFSVGIQGSVLAPYADVDFYWGSIDGQMIVGSIGAGETACSGEFHNVLFDGDLPSVPLPSTIRFFGGGLLGLAGLNRKRSQRRAQACL